MNGSPHAAIAIDLLREAERALEGTGVAGAVAALYDSASALAACVGDAQRALDWARAALALTPGAAIRVARLAALHAERGELKEAEAVLAVGEACTRDDRIVSATAEIQLRLGRPAEALSTLQQALEHGSESPDVHRRLAEVLFRRGNAEAAFGHALEAARAAPGDVAANAVLVHAAGRLGRAEEAVGVVDRSLARQPASADLHNVLGVALMLAGRNDEAEEAFRRAQALDGRHAEAHSNLGAVLARRGDREGARRAFAEAVRARPEYGIAHSNLGQVLLDLDRPMDALPHCQIGAFLCANTPICHAILGRALVVLGRHQEGLSESETALALDPALAAGHLFRASALYGLDRHEEAMAACALSVEVDPDNASAWSFLAHLARVLGDRGAATRAYGALLRLGPGSAEVNYLMRVARSEPMDRCDAAYIRSVFDAYAAKFDTHLVEQLEYRAPQVARDLVGGLEIARGVVLDLGCGTGLCGGWLRERATRLEGVDLSGEMLKQARGRGLYDLLEEADIFEFLSGRVGVYDLICSVDVLPYVGDLRPLLDACRLALREGGAFLFTTEAADGDGYEVQLNGRWRHGRAYVLRAAGDSGLTEVRSHRFVGRKELGRDVELDVFLLRTGSLPPPSPPDGSMQGS